jgi:hypothetical protein
MNPVDNISKALRAVPFQPFCIIAASGKVYRVRSPDGVALAQSGGEVFVHQREAVHRVRASEIVGVYPAEDVEATALIEANARGWQRGRLDRPDRGPPHRCRAEFLLLYVGDAAPRFVAIVQHPARRYNGAPHRPPRPIRPVPTCQSR